METDYRGQASFEYGFENRANQEDLDFRPQTIETLQLNITKLCNQQCFHCHVDSSPRRKEAMNDRDLEQVIDLLRNHQQIKTLDITGGAPELHPKFKDLVIAAKACGKAVMVRHNLTVTLDPHPKTKESLGYLPEFFKEHQIELVCSLPYHQESLTDEQRGSGVFKKSIESLKMLNRLGYGEADSGLVLNLVYNPVGAYLPPCQINLEADYKRELEQTFGIKFNSLFAIANMPIHRFKYQLKRDKALDSYMETLIASFNPQAADKVMCRSMISVSHDGFLYDCDFNQMLDLKLGRQVPLTIYNFNYQKLLQRGIRTADHCYGCTAGSGSSCGGTTTTSAT